MSNNSTNPRASALEIELRKSRRRRGGVRRRGPLNEDDRTELFDVPRVREKARVRAWWFTASFLLHTVLGVFLMAFFTGALDGGEISGDLHGAANEALVALGTFVGVAVLYGITTRALAGSEILRDSEFHNSFYFMGFIFTLSALAISVILIGFKIGEGIGPNGLPPDVIGSVLIQNAIAVTSTIVGLIMRNFLAFSCARIDSTNSVGGVEDVEAAVHGLADATPVVVDAMAGLQKQLANFNVSISETNTDLEKLSDRVSTLGRELRDGEGPFEAYFDTAQTSAETAASSIASMAQATSLLSADLQASSDATSQTAKHHAKLLGEAADALDKHLKTFREHVAATPRALDQAMAIASNNVQEATSQLAAAIKTGQAAYENQLADLGAIFIKTPELMSDAISGSFEAQLARGDSALPRIFESIAAEVHKHALATSQSAQDLEQATSAAKEAWSKHASELAKIAPKAPKTLNEILAAAEQLKENQSVVARSLKLISERLARADD